MVHRCPQVGSLGFTLESEVLYTWQLLVEWDSHENLQQEDKYSIHNLFSLFEYMTKKKSLDFYILKVLAVDY